MLLIPCVFWQFIRQPTNASNAETCSSLIFSVNCISLRVFVGWCIDKIWSYSAVCTLRTRWPRGSLSPSDEALRVYYSPLWKCLPIQHWRKPREPDVIQGLRLETTSLTTQSREARCLFRGSHTPAREIVLCESRMFITTSTWACDRSTWIQPTYFCLDSLILSFHLCLELPSALFPSRFRPKLCTFLAFPMCATSSAQLPPPHLSVEIIFSMFLK